MTRVQRFIDKAIEIANDDSRGYSQYDRWVNDLDCSSMVYICAEYAGYDVPTSGTRYTGTMISHFSAAGFRVDAFDGNLYDLEPGDILLNTAHHTAIYIGNGQVAEASQSETGGIDGAPGDQTGDEIHIGPVYNYPWTHVLTPPKDSENNSPAVPAFSPVSNDVKNMPIDDAITRIAIETINGRYGNGSARKEGIYAAVQDKINRLLSGKA